MKILWIDPIGAALDPAFRMQADGHQVKLAITVTEKTRHKVGMIGKGLVPLVSDWRDHWRWADVIIVSDNTKYLAELDAIRSNDPRRMIVSATSASAEWELNRDTGMKVFRKHGIDVPPTKNFSRYDDAIAHVLKENRAFVSKCAGDDKALSYVAKSPADLIYMLERWKKGHTIKGDFILQEKIKGVEMAVGGWFGPNGFQGPWCENFEFKKLCNGDMGPNTGEQGTVMRAVRSSKLATKVLAPLEDALARTGHVGYVDVNCIIDDDGTPWPLEFTMRFGWPCYNIQHAIMEGDSAEWLANLAEGRALRNWRHNEIAIGVVVAIPDYPYSHITRKDVQGVPIYFPPSLLPRLHPCEVMVGNTVPQDAGDSVIRAPCWVTAGDYVLIASASATTVSGARDAVNRVLDQVEIPNSPFWRTDIGKRLGRQIPALQAHGFAMGMNY